MIIVTVCSTRRNLAKEGAFASKAHAVAEIIGWTLAAIAGIIAVSASLWYYANICDHTVLGARRLDNQ